MPVPKQTWLKLPKAQRGNKTYQQYVAWTQKKTAQRTQKSASFHPGLDPYLDPLSPTQISQQAHRTVTSQTKPIIDQITKTLNRSQALGIQGINQNTAGVTKFLQPLAGQEAANYDFSMGQERAGGKDLANFLANTGQTQQADLAKQLNAAGLRPPSENFTQSGAAAGASTLAHGVSALDLMAAQRGADVGYALKAPGISQRVGAFNITNLQKDYAAKRADAIGQITQQVPGMVNQTYRDLLNQEFQKSVARQGFQMDMANLTETQKEAQLKNAAAAAKDPKISAGVSNNMNDGYAYDQSGKRTGGPWAKHVPGGAGGAGGKLRGRIDKASKEFLGIAQTARKAMISKLNPTGVNIHPFKPGSGEATKYIKSQREQIVAQVYAAWQGRFPGQTPDFWRQQTASTLAAAGWKQDASNLGYTGPGSVKPIGTTVVAGQQYGPAAGGAMTGDAGGGTRRTAAVGAGAAATTGYAPGSAQGQRASFTNAVASRAQRLVQAGRTPEQAYAVLVNYIMDVGSRTGQTISEKEAWKLAQFALSGFNRKGQRVQVGKGDYMNVTSPLGNPAQWIPGYKPYTPPRRGGPRVTTGGSTPGPRGGNIGQHGNVVPGGGVTNIPGAPVNKPGKVVPLPRGGSAKTPGGRRGGKTVPIDTSPKKLTPAQIAAHQRWLRKHNKGRKTGAPYR